MTKNTTYLDENGARWDYGHLEGKQVGNLRGLKLLGTYGPGEYERGKGERRARRMARTEIVSHAQGRRKEHLKEVRASRGL